jgi:hypothetical protein
MFDTNGALTEGMSIHCLYRLNHVSVCTVENNYHIQLFDISVPFPVIIPIQNGQYTLET